MRQFIFLIFESFRFAWQALRANVLRTLLSLLGVTVGIFSIVGVQMMVDSLESNIKGSLNSIGSNVIYVEKWPWFFGNGNYPWWKYFMRPMPKYEEFKFLNERLESADGVVMMGFEQDIPSKKGSNSINVICQGITYDFTRITEIPIESGRYFLPQEIDGARNAAIIGSDIAETLFPNEDPIGKTFKIKGRNFIVIGTQVKKGKQIADFGGEPDQKVFMPFLTHNAIFASGEPYGIILIQGKAADKGLVELESEITGLMRTKRGLRPSQEDNFAINRPEAATKALAGLFESLGQMGFVIGIFALLIGGFGIANIMFVSVRERTNIIGIQKSLGAKNYFILSQFLFEAVFLCLFGGLIGMGIVSLVSNVSLGSLDLILTKENVLRGLFWSTTIGVLAGIIPASLAARLNPVEAIRSK